MRWLAKATSASWVRQHVTVAQALTGCQGQGQAVWARALA